jgi:hypothetical protein
MSVDVEFPAVVAAADSVVLDPAEMQTAAPVSAAFEDHAKAALAVPEDDQILTQDPGAVRHVGGECRRRRDRVPVPPQRLAHRRARSDLGQPGVVGRRLAPVAGAGVGVGSSGFGHGRSPPR